MIESVLMFVALFIYCAIGLGLVGLFVYVEFNYRRDRRRARKREESKNGENT